MRRRLPPPLRRANAGRSNPTPNEPEHTRRRGGVAVVDPCGGDWHRRIAGAGRLHDLSRDRGGAEDRKSDVEGQGVTVRVDLAGRRFIKKKNKQNSLEVATLLQQQ